MTNIEYRDYDLTEFRAIRSDGDKPAKIVGYAALFNSLSQDLGGYREKISPGAFKRTLSEGADVRARFNHDSNIILGRTTAGTLRLKEDDKGLSIEIDPPDTQAARDLMVSMERGDITQMSFAFWPTAKPKIEKSGGEWIRTLSEVALTDVAIVAYPAYLSTNAEVRSSCAIRDKMVLDELRAAIEMGESAQDDKYMIDLMKRRLCLI